MNKRIIHDVAVNSDGSLQIGFVTPDDDAKANGVILVHTLLVPLGADYDDEIQAVLDAITYLVADVLDDWDKLDPAGAGTEVATS